MKPTPQQVPVEDLAIDLGNYRTARQRSERAAVQAMVSTSPDYFWALVDSLIADGYMPIENIIVLRTSASGKHEVKEGNRRVAAMKLLHGFLSASQLDMPDDVASRLKGIDEGWRRANASVPCLVYPPSDAATVDRLVARAHGKGEKAGRDPWNAVATARHNRKENGASEPALDLLEKFLEHGKQVTRDQRMRWTGVYPLSALDDLLKKLAPRLGFASAPALATAYPHVRQVGRLDALVHGIGLGEVKFSDIRNAAYLAAAGFPEPDAPTAPSPSPTPATPAPPAPPDDPGERPSGPSKSKAKPTGPRRSTALPPDDPRSVQQLLQSWRIRGPRRAKLAQLRNEALKVKVAEAPLIFCFAVRAMIEISINAYIAEHPRAVRVVDKDGKPLTLDGLVKAVIAHLSTIGTETERRIHDAKVEFKSKDNILSITTLNRTTHSTTFVPVPSDVARAFHNVFPFLEVLSE